MVLTVVWLALSAGFFLFSDAAFATMSAFGIVMSLVAIVLPVALIWVAAITARTSRAVRAEAAELRAALDSMRQAYLSQVQMMAAAPRHLNDISDDVPKGRGTTSPTFLSRREAATVDKPAASSARPAGEDQPTLALGATPDDRTNPVTNADFVKALNFPDDPNDREGFRAMRRALEDRSVAKLVRAAQDILTLLAQDGIYMDDLEPDRARPEIWRRFAQGERGRTIAALGGVRDRTSLALSAQRMRQDTIFRDAAHHFLRLFDRSITAFETTASDQDIAELAETRTARAFMLLGRVNGIFD
jgi:hypothetical protein